MVCVLKIVDHACKNEVSQNTLAWGAPHSQLLNNVFDLFNNCDYGAPQDVLGHLNYGVAC